MFHKIMKYIVHFRKLELENALLEECSASDIYAICEGKALPEPLRAEVWQICLDIQDKGDQLVYFNEIFDLPNQNLLREDCASFVAKLGNDDEDKVSVVSGLESILTYYSKSRNLPYEQNNGWIELLLPLLSLKLPLPNTYNLFEAIRDTYIPKGCHQNGSAFHVLRLLMLYHEPELCSFLDTKRITPDLYCLTWFQSLFAATCTLPVVLSMWDLYFQQADPFFIFFLSLIMVVNAKEQIMKLKDESKHFVVETISNMPCALEGDDVIDFCSLAMYYAQKTPMSFKTELIETLYGGGNDSSIISQALCLPVTAHELVENVSLELSSNVDAVRFFLVDCRPAEQYNAGHLPTAFHLDCNLMLLEPTAFATAVQGLLSAQRQALAANSNAGGEHLCFLGSGRNEEDQYTHMVIASFLQKHTQYVSMLAGGYKAIHDYFGDEVANGLQDHNPQYCVMCASSYVKTTIPDDNVKPTSDLLGKLSAAMKIKSQEVKGKLLDYIVNPNANTIPAQIDKHANSTDKNGKRYRNVAPVFSIDDDNENNVAVTPASVLDDEETKEIVSMQSWLKNPDVIDVFKCQEVKVNGTMYQSNLIITDSHLIVLREIPGQKGVAQVIVRRPLSSIAKITARKRHPQLITFKYGLTDGDKLLISDMDKFLIPEATRATKIVSEQTMKQLKAKDYSSQEN